MQTMGDKTMEGLHEIGHDLPEECLLFLSDQLPWSFHNIYTCLREMPSFQKIIGLVDEHGVRQRSTQVVKAFQSYKRCLQLLSYQTGNRQEGNNWTMKCPLHCYFIKELTEVFPDAKLIW
jgi:hypothetical protein